jgi:hypothetical protein
MAMAYVPLRGQFFIWRHRLVLGVGYWLSAL